MNGYQIVSEAIKPNYEIVPLTKDHCKKFKSQMLFNSCNLLKKQGYVHNIVMDIDKDDWIGVITYIPKALEIGILEVNKKYRRMGFAKMMLNLYPKAEMVFTEVKNKKARMVYERLGWKDSGLRFLRSMDKEIFQGMLYIKKPLFVVKRSKIAGQGAFLNVPLMYRGSILKAFEKVKNTGNPDNDYVRTELGKYVNHSEKPNLTLRQFKTRFYFTNKNKPIKHGDELTVDYRTFPWEGKRDFT
jgi:GNAT superfamily N-acetyltransferase